MKSTFPNPAEDLSHKDVEQVLSRLIETRQLLCVSGELSCISLMNEVARLPGLDGVIVRGSEEESVRDILLERLRMQRSLLNDDLSDLAAIITRLQTALGKQPAELGGFS